MINLDNFISFINNQQPIYEGNTEDDVKVKVILSKWQNESGFGNGEIYPYTIPSSYNDTDPHKGCFEVNSWINGFSFTEDNHSQANVFSFKVSYDFQSLTIIDHNDISDKALGVLKLIESIPDR